LFRRDAARSFLLSANTLPQAVVIAKKGFVSSSALPPLTFINIIAR